MADNRDHSGSLCPHYHNRFVRAIQEEQEGEEEEHFRRFLILMIYAIKIFHSVHTVCHFRR